MDNGRTLEVLRLCTQGDKDVCSFLYSRAASIAREMGYEKIPRVRKWYKSESERIGVGS